MLAVKATRSRISWAMLALVMLACGGRPAIAQGDFLNQFDGGFGSPFGDQAEDAGKPVAIDSQFTPATADRPAVLMVTASIAPDWHAYSINQGKLSNGQGPQVTKLTVSPSEQYKLIGRFSEFPKAKSRIDKLAFVGLELREHADSVTWYAPIEIAEGVNPAELTIDGRVTLQSCHDEKGCVPQTLAIEADLGDGVPIGPLDFSAPEAPAPTVESTTPTMQAPAGPAYDLSAIQFAEVAGENSLARNLMLAFFGGLILNLMPCVLPVIGLKVMSFVQQAGYSRSRALALNGWYSLGIVSVFWVLALLAIFAGLSWGKQFSSVTFNLVMASIVFTMALSLLGVWEIPVPEAVGRSSTHESVRGEGWLGAYLKGVLTTLLATPCTGPGMAVALGWAVKQPGGTVMMIFTVMGLGMASPYLLIGAFPRLVNFLPRPGAWMETFKQLMGFVLLGTVIFLLSLLPSHYLLPSMCLLTALGLASWAFSKMPIGAPFGERTQTYALCGAIVAAGAVFSFGWLAPLLIDDSDEWQAFSLARLNQVAVEEGKTVLVDFGADWCANCQVLEKTVLHTEPVEAAIKNSGVVTMFADNTSYPPEIEKTLSALKSNGVPVIAIFPGGAPYEPIVFRGIYTQGQLVEAIAQANAVKSPGVTKTAGGDRTGTR